MKNNVNEICISYKSGNTTQADKITSSKDAAKILFNSWDMNTIEVQETFKIMLLNRANKVKGVSTISVGAISGTLVDLRIIFAIALKTLSTGIILAHNHPSGNLTPSQADKDLTNKVIKAAKLFDIQVLDHIILGLKLEHFSFSDNQLM